MVVTRRTTGLAKPVKKTESHLQAQDHGQPCTPSPSTETQDHTPQQLGHADTNNRMELTEARATIGNALQGTAQSKQTSWNDANKTAATSNRRGRAKSNEDLVPKNTRMGGESEDHYTVVKSKKKRAKFDQGQPRSPSPSLSPGTSTGNSSTSASTSSTSTSSRNTDPPSTVESCDNEPRNEPVLRTVHPTKRTANENEPSICSERTNEISQQARRYAETRYAFPPFKVDFNQDVDENAIIGVLKDHYRSKFDADILFDGHRRKNKRNLLLFVQNRNSFLTMFDKDKWPERIESLEYEKTLPNHLPPQFSIVIKNVPVHIETNQLLLSIQGDYPDAINAFRISNKSRQPTTFVRLDIQNVKLIDDLLRRKYIVVDKLRLALNEYLAPAKVLLCSRCFQIGHFRSNCKSALDFCKTCGTGVQDIKEHKKKCNDNRCCVRCRGPHESNDNRCPDIKSYRAALTKSLLSTTTKPVGQRTSSNLQGFHYNDQDFPAWSSKHQSSQPRTTAADGADKRCEDLLERIRKVEENLNKLIESGHISFNLMTFTQQVIMKHDHELQLLQTDMLFQREFVS
jgi:hypothetical protein